MPIYGNFNKTYYSNNKKPIVADNTQLLPIITNASQKHPIQAQK